LSLCSIIKLESDRKSVFPSSARFSSFLSKILVERFSIAVKVADLPEVNAPKVTVLREIQLVTLTPAIRAERSIRRANGALVQSVSQRVADQLGIQAGDVILQINRVPIADAESAARALDYYAGRGGIVMYIERQGQVYTTEFVIQ
jgi:serine protease Do